MRCGPHLINILQHHVVELDICNWCTGTLHLTVAELWQTNVVRFLQRIYWRTILKVSRNKKKTCSNWTFFTNTYYYHQHHHLHYVYHYMNLTTHLGHSDRQWRRSVWADASRLSCTDKSQRREPNRFWQEVRRRLRSGYSTRLFEPKGLSWSSPAVKSTRCRT